MPKFKNSNETFWVIFKQCVLSKLRLFSQHLDLTKMHPINLAVLENCNLSKQ